MDTLSFVLYIGLAVVGLVVSMRIFRAYERTLDARQSEVELRLERQREMTLKAEGRWAKYYADAQAAKPSQSEVSDAEGFEEVKPWPNMVVAFLEGVGLDAEALQFGDASEWRKALDLARSKGMIPAGYSNGQVSHDSPVLLG